MLSLVKNIFAGRRLASLRARASAITALETEIERLSAAELLKESQALEAGAQSGTSLDEILPRAFALVREAARRTLNQRPYDVQLMGGIVLHEGGIAEMMTGEGKTLAAVAPAYLNALAGPPAGGGVHVVTVNEYLARRDAVWMGQIYRALGLSVACLVPNAAYLYDPSYTQINADEKSAQIRADNPRESALLDKERDTTGSFMVQQEFLKPISRREAYLADITYGTNHEFGFDYLRDNLAYGLTQQVQTARGGHAYAIIDEVDSILIDEARTPLIIAAPDTESSEFYKTFMRVVRDLEKEKHYTVDEKFRAVSITNEGIEKVEKMLGAQDLYGPKNLRLVHYLEESLKAKALFHRDKDYVVKNGEIVLVDEFTGRLLHGRRYSGGLHQAIEAKEGVVVQQESKTYARVSIQNYFRLYKKLSGMTGTAQTSAEEFHKVYGVEVVSIPPNKPCVRKDEADFIYKTAEARWNAVVQDIKTAHEKGQPVLVGTTSIAKNELLDALLSRAYIPHEVLNAKNNEREGAIIAQAGKPGAVTVATNMAGRGVDIILGGNPQDPERSRRVREAGGLHVIGTERHEARRIDNQLRGRSGRQGDPGSSRFYLSLEDDLLRIFGGGMIKNLMTRFDVPEDQPIEAGIVSKAVAQAQAKVEGANFDMRKHLLEYDDVLNKQRTAVYKRRQEILGSVNKDDLRNFILESASVHASVLLPQGFAEDAAFPDDVKEALKKSLEEAGLVSPNYQLSVANYASLKELLETQSAEAVNDPQTPARVLSILDLLWMNHLEDLEALMESIGLRAYGQRDPLVEYRHEAHRLFRGFWTNFNAWIFLNIFRMAKAANSQSQSANRVEPSAAQSSLSSNGYKLIANQKVGRNDPCPCGAKHEDGRPKKYKHCHGK
ncbi:MAG: preprotein translocase subunit SecA [Candidatus Liptonbacteria bacterium]|nr:preprotein translocase subunit SecA [Candidatus Liptonbacteria bacterium]